MFAIDIFKPKHQKQQELKERLLKNKGAVLDVMAESIKGARACEGLLGQKCLGQLCEKFGQYFTVDEKGNKKEYWRCAYNQTPVLLIEIAQEIRLTNKLLTQILEKQL